MRVTLLLLIISTLIHSSAQETQDEVEERGAGHSGAPPGGPGGFGAKGKLISCLLNLFCVLFVYEYVEFYIEE